MSGPPPRFKPDAYQASAGDVVLFLVNNSPRSDPHGVHTVAIGPDLAHQIAVSEEVPGAGRAVFTVRGLKVGEYVIWCTFPNHADLGQVGTLTVE
jgi:plastocyanin